MRVCTARSALASSSHVSVSERSDSVFPICVTRGSLHGGSGALVAVVAFGVPRRRLEQIEYQNDPTNAR